MASTAAVASGADTHSVEIQAATKAADTWLSLVDKAKYDESWKVAAGFLRSQVALVEWPKVIKGARTRFGKFISRKLTKTRFTTTIPGAPDGKYVVIEYSSRFDKKKEAVESVAPMQEKDGSWKVSGYYIK